MTSAQLVPSDPSEAAGRIRWRDDSDGGFVGTTGTAKALTFTIWSPGEDDIRLLVVFFTGLDGGCVVHEFPAASTDVLKAEGERWLSEFTSSLGAVFPAAVLKLADDWEQRAAMPGMSPHMSRNYAAAALRAAVGLAPEDVAWLNGSNTEAPR